MEKDSHLQQAARQVAEARESGGIPTVKAFFDDVTFAVTYVVHDPISRAAAIIDSVLDFDPPSGSTSSKAADQVIAYVGAEGLKVDWLLETHVHADHISAAPYLKERLGGAIAIGTDIVAVQKVFGALFNEGAELARDGSQFDRLFEDGDRFELGGIAAHVLHVPGHTPVDLAYVIGDAIFVGDTLFMPDYGSARADFPGGDAARLYRSIRRLLELPGEARVFVCHDYKAPGREAFAWESTIEAQRVGNVHVHEGVSEDEFVALRTQRDAKLPVPKMMLPAIQVNMRAGHLPEPEANGTRYLKIPLNQL